MSVRLQLRLGDHAAAAGERLAAWGTDDVLERMWARDHTVWSPEPVPELTDRLGWLSLPERLAEILPDLEAFRDELIADEIAHVVVLGMGGSSLAPEVFSRTLPGAPGAPELLVLDSTHPGAVLALDDTLDLTRTVFIVASKSGTTIEPLSFLEYYWDHVASIVPDSGRHFVATTDPGSRLESLARRRGFRRTFLAPPDVGGRYSALTEFGMVPAAAMGADLTALQQAAVAEQGNHNAAAIVAEATGCRLGAAIGELAGAGRDKLTFLTSADLAALPAWIEQLLAESTGKDGTGVIPVGGEAAGLAGVYGLDRFFVVIETAAGPPVDIAEIADHPLAIIRLDTTADIAGAMYVFEVATALAGAALGIQPFDQPDVQLAKELARDAMAGDLDTGDVAEIDVMAPDLAEHVSRWLDTAGPGDYIGIHAFIEPDDAARRMLERARLAMRDATALATTLDFGPRFLHSTGQLHKGGPNTGVFLEIIDHPTPPVPVPTTEYDFAKLVTAQALGDHLALRQRGRRLLLVCLGDSGDAGLQRLAETITQAALIAAT